MADINIAQVTTTDPTGAGVFDVLMRSVESHLDKQYVAGRIKGSDYATVYAAALQSVLQQAIAFVLTEQGAEEQIAASQANTTMKQAQNTAQVALINRQKDGFDEKYKQDVFNTLMGLRTTGLTQDHPGLNNDTGSNSANALANALITDAGITGVSNVIANVV